MGGPRWVLCGFVTGVVWNLLSIASLAVWTPTFVASIRGNAPYPALGDAFFFGVDIAMGIWGIWLYSAIVPRYGSRPTTVVIASTAWWILKTLHSIKWAGSGFIEIDRNILLLGVSTLVAATLSVAVGAWLYQHTAAKPPQEVPAT